MPDPLWLGLPHTPNGTVTQVANGRHKEVGFFEGAASEGGQDRGGICHSQVSRFSVILAAGDNQSMVFCLS